MWLLTCDGDVLEGKTIWLRPGITHVLGRTAVKGENGERVRQIVHKSVSRKHLIIQVSESHPGDSSKLHVRSEIKVTDASKVGTTLNGEVIKNETKKLDGKSYTIKLGFYEHLFHLKWKPIVLTFTGISKKAKDPLAARREQLKQTDIKLISDYVSNETTHVVGKKRNNPSALQALIQARWVVNDDFVEALAKVVAVDGSSETMSSLLEDDFIENWPKENEFPVPTTSEPKPRPDSFLKPNPDRNEIFQDFTFVFLAQQQYDTLLPVVTSGGGKALLRDAESPDTTVEGVVEYIKEAAGRKGSAQFRLSQQPGSGGIVVVRLNDRDEALRELNRNLDLALDQRSIEQNEFLDAILTLDTSGMRRQLEEDVDDAPTNGNAAHENSRPAPQIQEQREQRAVTIADMPPPEEQPRAPPPSQNPASSANQAEAMEQDAEQPAARRRNRRIITQSRFKGFDDDIDPSQFSKPAGESPGTLQNGSQASNSQQMEVDESSQAPATQRGSRKRPAPEPEEVEEDMYATILTSHAAMKRQKTRAAQNGDRDVAANSLGESGSAAPAASEKAKKKQTKEIDVMAEVKARRKEQEEQRRLDEEALKQTLEEGEEVQPVVEEMEIPIRERPTRNATEDGTSDRWDPAWNGRKNFKRFRQQGARRDGPRLDRVMVPLQAVPKPRNGVGDEYWLGSTSTNGSKSKSQSQSQSTRQGGGRSQQTINNEDEDDNNEATRFQRSVRRADEAFAEQAAREQIDPSEIAGRPRDQAIQDAIDSTPSQTLGTASQRKAAGKRPAAESAGGIAKKARQTTIPTSRRDVVTVDDDDDDGLKFRRRAKR